MSTESDLIALADRVRDFVDQEIPTVETWNINPDVLDEALRTIIGPAFTTVETGLGTTNDRIDGIVLPDGSLKPIGEWVGEETPPVFLSTTTFGLLGDKPAYYRQGSRLRVTLAPPNTAIAAVTSAIYNPGQNQTVIALATAVLTSALSKVEMSIVRDSLPQQRTIDLLDKIVTEIKMADNAASTRVIANLAVTSAKIALLAVGTGQLADQAVTDLKVGFKSLHATNLLMNNSLDGSQNIIARSVPADRLVANSIGSGEMAYNSLTGWHIQALSLGKDDIGENQIFGGAHTRTHIASGSIQGDYCIANESIWAHNKLRPGSIGDDRIAYRTIWGDNRIALRSIWGANQLAVGSVSSNELANRAACPGFIYGQPTAGNWHWLGFINGGEGQATDWTNRFPVRWGGAALIFMQGNVCRTAQGGGGTGIYMRLHRSGDAGGGYW